MDLKCPRWLRFAFCGLERTLFREHPERERLASGHVPIQEGHDLRPGAGLVGGEGSGTGAGGDAPLHSPEDGVVKASNSGGSGVTVTAEKTGGGELTITEGSCTITEPGEYTFTATTGTGITSKKDVTVHSVRIGDGISHLVVDGGKVTKPEAPEKTGYTFDCWMDGQNVWDVENDRVTDDLTLTARWTLDPSAVELTADKTEAIYGETITLTAEVSHAAGDSISAYTYEWYKGDGKLEGETGGTLTLTDVDQSGSYTVKVTASDGTLTSAQATSNAVSVTIGKANPVQAWPTASDITYGQSLRDSNLAGGSAVDGSFAWEDDTVYPESGTRSYTVVFTPDDPDNTVTVTLKDTDNYTWSDGSSEAKTYDFTIAKKPVTGTWQGLHQVYDGEPQEVSILLTGLESVDQGISAVIVAEDGDMTTAGSHTLHAELDNYAITPATATLVIQKQPVVVNVTDNVVTPGGEPEIKVPNLPDHDYDVIYKDKDGNEVADLTESGTYEVWVKFPEDGNYRHPDGSTEAPVDSVTVSETTPTLYTVSFDGDEATGGSMAPLELAGGSTLTLPQCGYTKTGFQFTGWLYGTTTYRPGDRVTTAYGDMTFTAQWQETTGSVSGLVDEDQRPVEDAVVSLWLGANQVAVTNTDGNGRYTFTDLLPGIYNLVVSHGQKTVTSMVEIDGGNETRNFSLPEGITNSVVEVTSGSPDLVVGNLDEIFNNTDGEDYTEEDAATVVNGGKVEITFNADEKQETEVQDDLEKLQSAGGSNLSLFLDCTLTKTVTDETGTVTKEIHQSSEVLEVRLPLPTELQGKYDYTVSRIHADEAQVLTTTANELGEYFEVNADKTVLTLHVRCFSTYAVGYRNAPSAPTYPPEKEESENGSYTVSPSRPGKGDTVTITPKPDEGYVVDGVTVIDQNGDPVDVEKNDDGTYSFTQPGGSVTITVTFRSGAAYDGCPRDKTCPMAAFPDLVTTAWYHDGVHYCLDEGLMEGHDDGTFGPNGTLTRAQLVQILWNLEGRPSAASNSVFTDVTETAWYCDAVT